MCSDYKILQRVNLKLQKWGEIETAQNAQHLDVRRINQEILRKQTKRKRSRESGEAVNNPQRKD